MSEHASLEESPSVDVRDAIEAIGCLFPSVDEPNEYERGYSDAINDAMRAVALARLAVRETPDA